jgi:uncharacterized protein (DUF433 family)
MALTLEARPIPLQEWDDGSIRIGGTRVTLETVLTAFNAGASADDIARRFDVLRLADVYSVIAYYLDNKAEVDAYLNEREQLGEAVRLEVERRFPEQQFLRDRLLARRAEQDSASDI